MSMKEVDSKQLVSEAREAWWEGCENGQNFMQLLNLVRRLADRIEQLERGH